VEVAAKRLSEFDASPWGKKYPMIAESWRRNWEPIILFYSYPPEVRHQRDRKFTYAAARDA
jgi:putative transposase